MATTDKKACILCIEDDPQMRTFLLAQFKARGFQTQAVRDGAQAIDVAAMLQPQLVLLDLSLPSLDGLTFLRRLREWSDAPVIVLSAHDEEPVKVKALDLGADDYLTKPFNMGELIARVRVALRHASNQGQGTPSAVFRTGELEIDFERRRVTVGGVEKHLTPTEYEVLKYLVVNSDKVITHRVLLHAVWGPEYETEAHYLRVFVNQLRRKIEPDPSRPRYIITEPGIGYRLRTAE